jgi:uncharacterized membrane protein
MTKTELIVGSALAVAVSMALQASAQAGPAPVPKFQSEKCYGVAKAGKNDCETKTSSCAGTSKRDAQTDAWLYVPKGTCEKLVGGSTQPKQG